MKMESLDMTAQNIEKIGDIFRFERNQKLEIKRWKTT